MTGTPQQVASAHLHTTAHCGANSAHTATLHIHAHLYISYTRFTSACVNHTSLMQHRDTAMQHQTTLDPPSEPSTGDTGLHLHSHDICSIYTLHPPTASQQSRNATKRQQRHHGAPTLQPRHRIAYRGQQHANASHILSYIQCHRTSAAHTPVTCTVTTQTARLTNTHANAPSDMTDMRRVNAAAVYTYRILHASFDETEAR